MSISAPNAKRAYPCTARHAPSIPRSQVGVDIKRALGKINLGIGMMKVQRRRKHPMLECQNGFDQSDNACCRIKMTQIALERTYGTVTRRGRSYREGACPCPGGKPLPYGTKSLG